MDAHVMMHQQRNPLDLICRERQFFTPLRYELCAKFFMPVKMNPPLLIHSTRCRFCDIVQ
jgi:hypothetical protein